MEIDLYAVLGNNPILLLFSTIGFGYLLGKIKMGGIQLGSTPGILIVGLFFGHMGFLIKTPYAATFGFTLFIFTVGLQAGPSFFSAFLVDGRRYFLLALAVSITALSMVVLITTIVEFEFGLNAGLLAGALTSTPTLAGAQDAITSGLATLPAGIDKEDALQNIGAAYAITYIFGTIGLILFINYFPKLLKIDLAKSAKEYIKERGLLNKNAQSKFSKETLPVIRAYEVSDDAVGKTIEQRAVEFGKRGKALRVRRGKKISEAEDDFVLEKGDVISFISNIDTHIMAREKLGHEILDSELISFQIIEKQIVVFKKDTISKPIEDLDLVYEFGCYVLKLIRAGIEIPVNSQTVIEKGDRIAVIGEKSNVYALASKVGYIEGEVEETDLVTFSFGVVIGLLIGTFVIKFSGLSFGIGSAGGLLVIGIIFGFLGSINPTFGLMPVAARNLLMEFGLAIFMASVGLASGGKVFEAIVSAGLPLFLSGMTVTIIPVLIAYAFGRKILKMNAALLFGAITGAMTSTPSLRVVSDISRSYVPSIGYAGTYTFSNVFLTFAGSLLLIF
jgi:putative transport protein